MAPVQTKSKRLAYFFLGKRPGGSFEGYSHSAVVLAEGLQELGWAIAADVMTWQVKPRGDYLFNEGSLDLAAAADLIVFGEDYFILQESDSLPDLPPVAKAPKIYLERSDLSKTTSWIYHHAFRRMDLILRCHSSEHFKYPGNVKPSVFGISNRIATACRQSGDTGRKNVLWNFNHKALPHSVRTWAESKVRPILESKFNLSTVINNESEPDSEFAQLMRRQTNGRHYTSYFQRLTQSIACSCFGGWFLLPFRQREGTQLNLLGRAIMRRIPLPTPVIAQWDSWRLWEAFAAGTPVIHVDFEHHRFQTGGPQPQPMEHYVPICLDKPYLSLSAVLHEPNELLRIGQAGKNWALEHYSSRSIALRTLRSLGLSGDDDFTPSGLVRD